MDKEQDISIEIKIEAEPINLVRLIKLDPEISGGGEAKILITEGLVQLNGVTETRKRKKVFHGDIITYHHRRIRVMVAGITD